MFKTNVSASTLSMNVFEIQPSLFEIQERESIVLEILFKPSDNTHYEQEIVIACDNCINKELKIIGVGQLAQVELNESDEIFENDLIQIDEFKDYWAKHVIKFPTLNPNMFTKKKIGIMNKSYEKKF